MSGHRPLRLNTTGTQVRNFHTNMLKIFKGRSKEYYSNLSISSKSFNALDIDK